MSKFLEILKVALADPKYGSYIPNELVSKQGVVKRRPLREGYYGNEDGLKQWWDTERKIYF